MSDLIDSNDKVVEDGYEKSDINLRKVFIFGALSTFAVIISVVLIINYYNDLKERIFYQQVLLPESEELLELRRHEADIMNSYSLLDSINGIYKIPIDSAMKIMTEKESGFKANQGNR